MSVTSSASAILDAVVRRAAVEYGSECARVRVELLRENGTLLEVTDREMTTPVTPPQPAPNSEAAA